MTTEKSSSKANNRFEYEFGGPVGTTANYIFLPLVILSFVHWTDVGEVDLGFLSDFGNMRFWESVRQSKVLCPSCDAENLALLGQCALGCLAWFFFQVFLERFLPGEVVVGLPVKGDVNNRLAYRINGHLAFWVTLTVLQVAYPSWHEASQTWQFGSFPLTILHTYFGEIALATIGLSFLLSFYLYLSSFYGTKILADGGNSGNPLYDFFMGRELNPRIGSFDWKEFCELRPGLIGWMLLNLSCMMAQAERLGYVTGSMILINLFQAIYVWDAQFQERAILSTMDITTDGFGFMLVFGDLAWVPFTYSIQAKYLVKHDPQLSYPTLAAILAVYAIGYSIFRGANSQKDAFRRDPNHPSVSHLEFLQTKRGTKLLTSGWWGMARKINYTGDWIMGLSWCMLCGFHSIVPYFYAIYFCILLIHRSIRDDHLCQQKYGSDWDTYKELVPYRFIPGVV